MRGTLCALVCAATLLVGPAAAQQSEVRSLDQLIQQFNAGGPAVPGSPGENGVRVDGWVETGPDGQELVVVIEPEGEIKLVADPGITVTPTERSGVEWLTPLPHHYVDAGTDYFVPPATVRLPFRASDGQPIELRVDYAYCLVDFQCFFGEETLTVATTAP